MIRRKIYFYAVVALVSVVIWQSSDFFKPVADVIGNTVNSIGERLDAEASPIDFEKKSTFVPGNPPPVSSDVEKLFHDNNAVFGIDQNGMLNLYNGELKEENVIRAFFQIDMEHLKSSLPVETVQQLQKGIRVTDKEEYYSVLSTFSDYATESMRN